MSDKYLCERCGGTGQQPEECWSVETNSFSEPAGICTTCNGEGYLGVICKSVLEPIVLEFSESDLRAEKAIEEFYRE